LSLKSLGGEVDVRYGGDLEENLLPIDRIMAGKARDAGEDRRPLAAIGLERVADGLVPEDGSGLRREDDVDFPLGPAVRGHGPRCVREGLRKRVARGRKRRGRLERE